MQILFTVPGRISGKGRPRISTRGGKIRAFTPAKTAADEAVVRQFASEAMGRANLFDGPIGLTIAIFKLVTPTWSKKKQAAAFFLTGRPDTDNVAKLIGDALNGIVWRDDAQIADLHVKRRYIREGQERVEITITELTDPFGAIAQIGVEGQARAVDLDSAARAAPLLPMFAAGAA